MAEPVRIVFVGQRDWCDLLADTLGRLEDPRFSLTGFEIDRPGQAFSPPKLMALARADVLMRVGFRPGASTRLGRAFEAFWGLLRLVNPRARVVFYWIGTDVSLAAAQVAGGGPTRAMYRLARGASHYAVTDDLVGELAAIGVEAKTVAIPWTRATFPDIAPPLPSDFTVLTYIPDGRSDFYGGPEILAAAAALPGARFRIMGGSGGWAPDAPANVEFLGWVADPAGLLADSSLILRLTEHDGQGAFAIEGLLYGRPVVYSRALPHCDFVAAHDEAALVSVLTRYLALHERDELELNLDGMAWARENYLPEVCARRMADALLAEAARHAMRATP